MYFPGKISDPPPEFSCLSLSQKDFLLIFCSQWSKQIQEQFKWREGKPGLKKANTRAVQGKGAAGQENGNFLSYSGRVAVISIENLRDFCDSGLRILVFSLSLSPMLYHCETLSEPCSFVWFIIYSVMVRSWRATKLMSLESPKLNPKKQK